MTESHHDPIAHLVAEHNGLIQLFSHWRALARRPATPAQRQVLAEQICLELTIHARLESELLHPLAREALGEREPLDEAADALVTGRELTCQVLLTQPQEPLYEERVNCLCAFAESQFAREEQGLFPRLRGCGADLALLGHRLRERRRELEAVPEALREAALASAMA